MNNKTIGRFHRYIKYEDPKECWLWTASLDSYGYGHMRIGLNLMTASRISWIIYKGPITKGMHVLHTCDVRSCVNPSHLYLGTHKQNMKDMKERNRLVLPKILKGSFNHNCKLSSKEILKIKDLKKNSPKTTYLFLANAFGVSTTTISRIITNQTYKDVI